jgi:O-antigen ligase
MLKAWFVFPLLMLWLIFQVRPNGQIKSLFLNTWFVTALLVACGAFVSLFSSGLTYDGRLAAWFTSPNYLAIFIAPGILIAFYKLHKIFEEKKETQEFFPLLLSFPIFLTILFLTRSYGAWLGVFAAAFLMIFLSLRASGKKNLWKILAGVIIIAGAFLFFERDNTKWQSLASFENRSSMASRVMIWQAAGKMISDNPVFGIGLGRFQETYLEYQKYFPPYLEWAVPQPHNIILAVWLETGLIGLIGFLLLIVHSIYVLLRNKNREAVLFLGLLTLFLLYGLFDTPFFKTDLAFSFWLVIALIFTFSQPAELPSHKSMR